MSPNWLGLVRGNKCVSSDYCRKWVCLGMRPLMSWLCKKYSALQTALVRFRNGHLRGMTFMQGLKFFTCPRSLSASLTHLLDCWSISLRQLLGDQDPASDIIMQMNSWFRFSHSKGIANNSSYQYLVGTSGWLSGYIWGLKVLFKMSGDNLMKNKAIKDRKRCTTSVDYRRTKILYFSPRKKNVLNGNQKYIRRKIEEMLHPD
ncbi:uncharacterized protein TNCV_1330041 [Trichonephila clavipes]|uniref:Uncharacterized protein n=1 Tax=Trichonephila clavipes TaxID=2585209 RepID=A0A8X6R7D2_TRICX|nr:uncharacterized protein TNCV_1330041 [Trichonephila clavipes]